MSCERSIDGALTLVVDLIGQLTQDVISGLFVCLSLVVCLFVKTLNMNDAVHRWGI